MTLTRTMVTLSLPNTPDVNRLKEMYENLLTRYEKQRKMLDQSIHGLMFDKQFYDTITSCYPNDHESVIPNSTVFVRKMVMETIDKLSCVTELRYAASVSGAMRWPWSQEARISDGMRYD